MALDKQKILSELGSVMNQLKGAECGCMGRLFGNTNTNSYTPNISSPTPASGDFRHGCCSSHGCNRFTTPCGSVCSPSMASHHINQPCMGHCNPSKLYGDTYQYLNENLMQPVVKDVYNDLKTITPANTVMNNQLGNSTIASEGQNSLLTQNKGGMNTENMTSIPNQAYRLNPRMEGHMSGMGPDIVNMMMSGNKTNMNDIQKERHLPTHPMVFDAPQSPHGKEGVTPLHTQMNTQQGHDRQMPTINRHFNNIQGNLGTQMQVPSRNISNIPNLSSNTVQQMEQKHKPYGQHSHGIAKFNEMFPGVMQNSGGDLDFDPMAIAVQMNPVNQQRTAIDTMHKIMNNNKAGINRTLNPSKIGQPPTMATPETTQNSHLASNLAQSSISQNQIQLSNAPTNELRTSQLQPSHHTITNSYQQIMQNQEVRAPYSQDIKPQQQFRVTTASSNNQQPIQHQQTLQGHDQQFMQQQTRTLLADSNTNPYITSQHFSPNNEEIVNSSKAEIQHLSSPQIIKEPIYPVNTSENQQFSQMKRPSNYAYNTLGQPIEMLPAKIYHTEDPGGPQTLSPQYIPTKPKHDSRIFSNVKSTVSKTSIMGNRPVGRNPSKSQLPHIYNQYKGSQSLTQQSILDHNKGASHSEGKLKIPQQQGEQAAASHQLLVEKFGGDTLPDNNEETVKRADQVTSRIGDAPNVNEVPNNETQKQPGTTRIPKSRNGLQDMVYTSYPSSAAWSFHGHGQPPFTVGARIKTRF